MVDNRVLRSPCTLLYVYVSHPQSRVPYGICSLSLFVYDRNDHSLACYPRTGRYRRMHPKSDRRRRRQSPKVKRFEHSHRHLLVPVAHRSDRTQCYDAPGTGGLGQFQMSRQEGRLRCICKPRVPQRTQHLFHRAQPRHGSEIPRMCRQIPQRRQNARTQSVHHRGTAHCCRTTCIVLRHGKSYGLRTQQRVHQLLHVSACPRHRTGHHLSIRQTTRTPEAGI